MDREPISIQPEDVPAGYIVSSSAQPQTVTVTDDLVATPNSISFTCYDANITGTLTINYYDAADLSKPIATEQRLPQARPADRGGGRLGRGQGGQLPAH